MRREASEPRPDFEAHAAEIGFRFAHIDGQPYWDESVRYIFSMREIEDDLETATAELASLCMELVPRVVASERLMERLRIPPHGWDVVADSWARRDPSLYGRFDLAYDGYGPPKLLEYNSDTPTSLFEAAVVQWFWLEQMIARGLLPEGADQFNSLHERLIERWRTIVGERFVHLACMSASDEDTGTVAYLADCAKQAGSPTSLLDMADIGLSDDMFVDRAGRRIDRLFKLYPWEWMFADAFGHAPALRDLRCIEPAWKAILSNKGFLALLWEAAPDHPNLLPCFFEDDEKCRSLGRSYARKPLLSREGANIELIDGARTLARTSGDYGAEGFVRQALHLLPDFGGRHPVLGCWLIGDAPAGMGVREDVSLVTSDRARFVPHAILG